MMELVKIRWRDWRRRRRMDAAAARLYRRGYQRAARPGTPTDEQLDRQVRRILEDGENL